MDMPVPIDDKSVQEQLRDLTSAIELCRAAIAAEAQRNEERYDKMMSYVDKTLHLSSLHSELYSQRSSRPYYPLDNGWGLTSLDTGQRFFVNTTDRNIAPWIIMGGHWERNVDRVLMTYAREGMHVLDIGAHFGYYTVKLGTRIGYSGRLLAFEPNPEVSDVCEENIKINGLAGYATLYKHALGDAPARAVLTRSKSNMASANLVGLEAADYSVVVDVKRLDDVIDDSFTPDLIKLDAEGYEKRILDGAKEVLARSPNCAIMIELGLEKWESVAALDDLIPSCGGHKSIYAVHGDGTLQPFSVPELRPFLLTCGFHENYFLLAPREQVESRAGDLIRR